MRERREWITRDFSARAQAHTAQSWSSPPPRISPTAHARNDSFATPPRWHRRSPRHERL